LGKVRLDLRKQVPPEGRASARQGCERAAQGRAAGRRVPVRLSAMLARSRFCTAARLLP